MDKIRCASCRYARQDKKASEYARKACGVCEVHAECEVCHGCAKRSDCKARQNPKAKQSCERRTGALCSQQVLKWAAIECVNPDSEYHKALLNVSMSGAMQQSITWNGCTHGERRCDV